MATPQMIATPQIKTPSRTDQWPLLLPILADFGLGLGCIVMGAGFGVMLGFAGNDSFMYRCAGAAAFGYPVGLVMALRQQRWSALRLPVIATLTLNVTSIFACAMEILNGNAQPIVYVVGILSVVIAAITASQLKRYAGEPRPAPDISPLLRGGLILGGVLAGVFGVLPLLIPAQFVQLFGLKGTDVFVIRQAGAASVGYGVMAFYALKWGVWRDVRISTTMALIFNGLGFVASVIAFFAGDPKFIVVLIGAASFVYTVMIAIALARDGKIGS